MLPIPILSPEESAAWDAQAETSGIVMATLMESAGRATACVLGQRYPGRLAGGVIIGAGPGNNGGDGWVVARALHRLDVPVWVAPLPGTPSDLNSHVSGLARAEGVRSLEPDGPWPGAELVVDAILGTGAKGAPRPPAQALLDRMHDLAVPVVAIDGPTGVDLGTGTVYGQARADLSITFGGLRRGHALARDQVGDVVVVDIGHPPCQPDWPLVVTDRMAAQWLPQFPADAHKGTRGRVVIVGGDDGMSGALRLAGRAAFAAGAGLVHAVAPRRTIDALIEAEPDLQTVVQDFDDGLGSRVAQLIERADAVIVGPGLGRTPARYRLVLSVISAAAVSVIDADGLIALADHLDDLRAIAKTRPLVLTPHPGEFRALFPGHAGHMEVDPWQAAADAAEDVGATVILKGVPSVVAAPEATTQTIVAGNPGLATGGSGDVLSGLVGAFAAQGLAPAVATALGGHVLGRAADLAARRRSARGLRPMDVVAALPDLWLAWRPGWAVAAARPPVLFDLPRPLEV
ncbi:MAG: NAD(P)H-hydrate dehydratase [Gemmatimonadetes bacterium]|nr:MAG: NAD(P)H-hydrate dehydratase [Gemmatimonadota bacterium]